MRCDIGVLHIAPCTLRAKCFVCKSAAVFHRRRFGLYLGQQRVALNEPKESQHQMWYGRGVEKASDEDQERRPYEEKRRGVIVVRALSHSPRRGCEERGSSGMPPLQSQGEHWSQVGLFRLQRRLCRERLLSLLEVLEGEALPHFPLEDVIGNEDFDVAVSRRFIGIPRADFRSAASVDPSDVSVQESDLKKRVGSYI